MNLMIFCKFPDFHNVVFSRFVCVTFSSSQEIQSLSIIGERTLVLLKSSPFCRPSTSVNWATYFFKTFSVCHLPMTRSYQETRSDHGRIKLLIFEPKEMKMMLSDLNLDALEQMHKKIRRCKQTNATPNIDRNSFFSQRLEACRQMSAIEIGGMGLSQTLEKLFANIFLISRGENNEKFFYRLIEQLKIHKLISLNTAHSLHGLRQFGNRCKHDDGYIPSKHELQSAIQRIERIICSLGKIYIWCHHCNTAVDLSIYRRISYFPKSEHNFCDRCQATWKFLTLNSLSRLDTSPENLKRRYGKI